MIRAFLRKLLNLEGFARELRWARYRRAPIVLTKHGLRVKPHRTRAQMLGKGVIVWALLSGTASAQLPGSFEAITVSTSAVRISATTLAGMASCLIRVETDDIRYRFDATAPTATVGMLLNAGQVLHIPDINDAANIRMIRSSGASNDATVSVTCSTGSVAQTLTSGTLTFTGDVNAFDGVLKDAAGGDSVMDTANDAVKVNIVAGASSGAIADDADFTDGTTTAVPIGGVAEAASPSTVTEGDFGWAAITLNRAWKTSLFNAAGTAAFGTAGTAATPVLTVQGIASMTPLSANLFVGGSAVATDEGANGATVPRFTLATDDPTAAAIGTTADAAATAGGEGSVSAKLRNVTALLDSIDDTLDNGVDIKINGSDPLGEVSTATLQSAVTANADGTVLSVNGYSAATLTVNCSTCSGGTTVNFEASEDGTNFVAVTGQQQSSPFTIASSTTTAGLTYWRIPVNGFQHLRARIGGYSAGTVTVTGRAVFSPATLNFDLLNPCKTEVQTSTTLSVTADTVLVSAATGKKNYLCSIIVNANAAEIVSLFEGTGSACGTSSVALLGDADETENEGMSLAANGGFTLGNGSAPVISGKTAASDMCLRLSGSSRVVITYSWVQR